MAKPPNLPHVKFVQRPKRVYAYFDTGIRKDGKAVYEPLPPLSDPAFYPKYGALKAGRTKRAQGAALDENSVSKLIDNFLSSEELSNKAKATQDLYKIQLLKAQRLLGKFGVNELSNVAIDLVLANEKWNAGSRNAFIAAIGSLYRWARKRRIASVNPVDGVDRLETGTYEPWPEAVLDAALCSENDRVRLAVHLLYYTGQRIGDVCSMTWHNFRDGWFIMTQKKTRALISFPVPSALAAELAKAPRHGITVLTNTIGARLNEKTLRDELNAFVASHGIKRVPHGLRKNAVNMLLEQGCTHAEVQSITGQSIDMVQHYAQRVDRRKLGAAAVVKIDAIKNRSNR
jgi:integrase